MLTDAERAEATVTTRAAAAGESGGLTLVRFGADIGLIVAICSSFCPRLGPTSAVLSRIYFAHSASFPHHSFDSATNSGMFSWIVSFCFDVFLTGFCVVNRKGLLLFFGF